MATVELEGEDFFALVSIEEKSHIPEALAKKLQDVWAAKVKEVQSLKVDGEKQRLGADQEIFQLEKQLICIQGHLEEEANGRRENKKLKDSVEARLTQVQNELQQAKTKVTALTRDLQQVQNEKDNASSQSAAMVGSLESRSLQITELQEQIHHLNQQLSECSKTKNEAVIVAEEAISRERQLKYREKRLEQEQSLMTRQVAVLQHQLEQRSEETLTQRTSHSSTILSLQTDLNHKIEELRVEKEEREQLKRQVKEKGERIQELLETLNESRESEVKLEETFRQELQAQQKLTEIYKGSTENEKERASELERAVEELRKLLNEASQQYGALERAKGKADQENAEALQQSTNLVKELKDELDKVNLLLQASANKGENGMDELSPAATAASELVSRGLSLTQLYAEYLSVSDKSIAAEEENKRLKRYVDQILQEIEERVPVIKKQREDHQKSLETITALQTQLEEVLSEREKQRGSSEEAVRRCEYLERENHRLEVQVKDVSRQVAILVTQVEAARAGLPPPPIHKDPNKRPSVAGDVISEHLVAFRDAAELQEQNSKLRASLRELSAQLEATETTAVKEKTKDLQSELDSAQEQLKELSTWRDRQEGRFENLVQQRDMYRALLNQQSNGTQPVTKAGTKGTPAADKKGGDSGGMSKDAAAKAKRDEAEAEAFKKELSVQKKEHEEYRTEKAKNDKLLQDDYQSLKVNMDKTRNENIKLLSQAEYNDERIKTLHTNTETLQRQLAAVEKNNTTLQGLVGRHEGTIDSLRSEYLMLQKKLSRAEVAVDNLREERTLLKESEARLMAERESVHRGQTSQAMVLANLESIKINLERKDADERMRHINQVHDLTQQLARTKAKMESNADLKAAREKLKELEGKIKSLHSDHSATTKQLAEARTELSAAKKKVVELQEKAKIPPGRTPAAVSQAQLRDLETQLSEEKHKVTAAQAALDQTRRSLSELIDLNKQHEKQLEDSNQACKTAREEFTKLQKEAEETESERAKLEAQVREAVEETETIKSLLTSKLAKVEDELQSNEKKLSDATQAMEKAKEEEKFARTEANEKINIAREAQDKYEREVMLHGADLKALATLKEQQAEFAAELQEATAARVKAEEAVRDTRLGFEDRENVLRRENKEMLVRCNELEETNKSILDQFTQLSDKMAALQTKFASPEGESESGQSQASEDEARTSDQLREVMKFLRRERDVAAGKCEVAQAESTRLEAQRTVLKTQVDQLSKDLSEEREKNQVEADTSRRCAELLLKVQNMEALSDSNRLMRREKEGLQTDRAEYKAKFESLEKQIEPLQEKLRFNVNKIEAMMVEKKSLETEKELFKKRTQELVEKLNRAKPEDFVKLQQEVTEQQKALQSKEAEVNRLKNQLAQLSRNQQMIMNQRNHCQQQLNATRDELRRSNEEVKRNVMEKTRTIQQHIDENKKVVSEKARLQQQLVQQQERVRGLESAAQHAHSTHQQEMSTFMEENKKVIIEKNRLQQQVTEVKQSEESLKQQIEATKKEAESLSVRLKDAEAKLAEALKKADNFEKQSSQLRKIATKYKKAAEGGTAPPGAPPGGEEAEEKMKEFEENISTLNKKLETAALEVNALTSEIETLKQIVATKEADNNMIKSQKETEVGKLKTDIQELESAKTIAAQYKQTTAKQVADLNKKLDEFQCKSVLYEGRVTQLEKEKEQLNQEIEVLNKKLQMQQRQLENLQKQAAAGGSKPAASVVCDKSTFEPPPTANIKPMNAPVAGSASPRCQAATQVVPPSRAIPTASIRPMAPPSGPGASQGSTVMVVPPLETHSDGLVSSTVTLPQATVTPTPAISAPTILTTATTTPAATTTMTTTLTATVSPTPTSVSITTPTVPPTPASITSSQPPSSQPPSSQPPSSQPTPPATKVAISSQSASASQSSTQVAESTPATQSTSTGQGGSGTPGKATTRQTAAATSSITAPQSALASQSTSTRQTALASTSSITPAVTAGATASKTAAGSQVRPDGQDVSADTLVSQAIALVSPLSSQDTGAPARTHKRPLESSEAVTNTVQAKRSRPDQESSVTQEPGPSSSHPTSDTTHTQDNDEDDVIFLESDDEETYQGEEEESEEEDEDVEDEEDEEDDDDNQDVHGVDSDDDKEMDEGMAQDENTREMEVEEGETGEVDEDMGDAEAEAEAEASPQVPGDVEDSRGTQEPRETPSESQPQPSPGPSQPSSTQTGRPGLVLPRPSPRQDRSAGGRQLPPFTQLPTQYDEGGDDSIVPSTPTLFVPRRGDAFPDPGTSPHVPSAGFVFGNAAAQDLSNPPQTSGLAQMAEGGLIDDTRMDLAQLDDTTHSHPSTPVPRSPAGEGGAESGVSTSEGEASARDPGPPPPPPPVTATTASASSQQPAPPAILVTGADDQSPAQGQEDNNFPEADSVAAEVGEDQATPHSQGALLIDLDDDEGGDEDEEDEGDDDGEQESGEAEQTSQGSGGEAEHRPQDKQQQEEERGDSNSSSNSQPAQEVSSPTQQPSPSASGSTAQPSSSQQRRIVPITWDDSPNRNRGGGGRGFPLGRGNRPMMRNPTMGGRGFSPQQMHAPQMPSRGTPRARRSRPGTFARGQPM